MRAVWFLGLLLSLVTPASAQDRDGEDHPMVPRYSGASIIEYRAPSRDTIVLPIGEIASDDASTNLRSLEGRITHIDYRVKPATAALQLEQHYQALLTGAGFESIYSCTGRSCGKGMGSLILNSGRVAPVGFADGLFNDTIRVLVARRGDTWVLLHLAAGPDRSQIYQAVVDHDQAGNE